MSKSILGLALFHCLSAQALQPLPPPSGSTPESRLALCYRLLVPIAEDRQDLTFHYYSPQYRPVITLDHKRDILLVDGVEYARAKFLENSIFMGGTSVDRTLLFQKVSHLANQGGTFHVYDRLSQTSQLYQEIQKHLEVVYRTYLERNILTAEEIFRLRELEASLSIERSSYFVFSDPRTDEVKSMIRLYDGSPYIGGYAGKRGIVIDPDFSTSTLPIEREYPHLKLPEREGPQSVDATLVELGRLSTSEDIEDRVEPLLSQIAFALYYRAGFSTLHRDGTVYIEATEAGARLYEKKYGFRIAYGPTELGIPPHLPARYILKMGVSEFQNRFYKGFFSPKLLNQ